MAVWTFPYTVSYGEWDDSECTIGVELTQEAAERLAEAAKKARGGVLRRSATIRDVYDAVHAAVLERMVAAEREDLSSVEDFLQDEADNWDEDEMDGEPWDGEREITDEDILRYLDTLTLRLYYPPELRA